MTDQRPGEAGEADASESDAGSAEANGRTVRLTLPPQLRRLAGVGREVAVEVEGGADSAPTLGAVLDALEARHPELQGTIRDHGGGERRAMIRFLACGRDLSHEGQDATLPDAVATGAEPLHVVGAIAGG